MQTTQLTLVMILRCETFLTLKNLHLSPRPRQFAERTQENSFPVQIRRAVAILQCPQQPEPGPLSPDTAHKLQSPLKSPS